MDQADFPTKASPRHPPAAGAAMSSATPCSVTLPVRRVNDTAPATREESDSIAVEIPVAIEFNGINHAVMLATPADLEDFAWGFALTEGIVRSQDDIRDVEEEATDQGIILHVQISPACMDFLKQRRRQMAGRTACGLCGVETLDAVRRLPPVPPASRSAQTRNDTPKEALTDPREQAGQGGLARLLAGMAAMRGQQRLHQETGATHAAAWLRAGEDRPVLIREDVGRHNALDKTIGALLRQALRPAEGALLVSSRASFEMVQKTAMAGSRALAAVSAPTSAAIALAHETGVTLLGFTRDRQATIYTHPEFFL